MTEESLFAAALERVTEAERRAFLAEAAAGDDALRRRVERLLAADGHADGPLDGDPDRGPPPPDPPPAAEGPGDCVGRYKLKEQIGEGGFGLVFVAEQLEPVRRKVALKVIKPGMDTREVVGRFEAERQALALMDHPNIAQVYDAGATDSGRPYFVMELVRGVAVTAYADRQQVPTRDRLELFVAVCRAVQHAHQKGVIHRDLKPSNVLVTEHDGRPVVKVIDFGVAKALNQQLTERSVYTRFAQMVGTPTYMSPEQAALSGLDVDTRSDIYSLGVLLYELLTGTTPFDRERLKTVGFDEMRRIIREEEPPKPSARVSTLGRAATTILVDRRGDPRRLSRLLRGELDWIVMKCLEKDRTRRYETATDLARDVEHYLNLEPVEACPPSAVYRLRKFARRRRAALVSGAVVFLAAALAAAAVGWAWLDRAARDDRIERADAARRAEVETCARDSLSAARALVAENKLAPARENLAQARALLANDPAAPGRLAADVNSGVDGLDRFQTFLDLIERANEAETAPSQETTAAGGSAGGSEPAPNANRERRPAAAVPYFLSALRSYRVLESDDWPTGLDAGILGPRQVGQVRRLSYEVLLWLADDAINRREDHQGRRKLTVPEGARLALSYLDRAASAQEPTHAFFRLRSACQRSLGDATAAAADAQRATATRPTIALDHYLQGLAAYDAKQLGAGVQAFERALRLEPTHYWSLMRLGHCLCDLGQRDDDFAGAVRVFTGCILKRPEHAFAYYCRANAYARLGRLQDAVADYSRALELEPAHVPSWRGRGVAYRRMNCPAEAVGDLSRALELDPDDASTWYSRGTTFGRLGSSERALADLTRAIDLDPRQATYWCNRGVEYGLVEQPRKAIEDFDQAIELDPTLAKAWNNRGSAHRLLGHVDAAIADFSRAIELSPTYAFAWNNRGATQLASGKLDQAIADCTRAADLAPRERYFRQTLGKARYRAGDYQAAVADLEKALELARGEGADIRLLLAIVHHKLGRVDDACLNYAIAVEWVHRNQARLEKEGRLAEDLARLRAEADQTFQSR
jgi:serine/threonine protein kinase/tetratricopeptide (TPR) repeat protein